MISVGGISSANWVTNSFSGALRTWCGSLTTSVCRVDPIEQVRGRDVGEVERRVLAHQDHVQGGEVDGLWRAEADMVAALAADLERPRGGDDPALPVAQLARQVVVEPVAALLRLQRQGEAAVRVDVDGLERVHLDRDGERHA